MGQWQPARRRDGTLFSQWTPTTPGEEMPEWGPDTLNIACPVCGAQYPKVKTFWGGWRYGNITHDGVLHDQWRRTKETAPKQLTKPRHTVDDV